MAHNHSKIVVFPSPAPTSPWKRTLSVKQRALHQLSGVTLPNAVEFDHAAKRIKYLDYISGKIERINLRLIQNKLFLHGTPLLHINLELRYGLRATWNPADLGLNWVTGDYGFKNDKRGIVLSSTAKPTTLFSHWLDDSVREIGASVFCALVDELPTIDALKKKAAQEGWHIAVQVLPVDGNVSIALRGPEADNHMRLLLTLSRERLWHTVRQQTSVHICPDPLIPNIGPVININDVIDPKAKRTWGAWLKRRMANMAFR